eukprot:g32463.t1
MLFYLLLALFASDVQSAASLRTLLGKDGADGMGSKSKDGMGSKSKDGMGSKSKDAMGSKSKDDMGSKSKGGKTTCDKHIAKVNHFLDALAPGGDPENGAVGAPADVKSIMSMLAEDAVLNVNGHMDIPFNEDLVNSLIPHYHWDRVFTCDKDGVVWGELKREYKRGAMNLPADTPDDKLCAQEFVRVFFTDESLVNLVRNIEGDRPC